MRKKLPDILWDGGHTSTAMQRGEPPTYEEMLENMRKLRTRARFSSPDVDCWLFMDATHYELLRYLDDHKAYDDYHDNISTQPVHVAKSPGEYIAFRMWLRFWCELRVGVLDIDEPPEGTPVDADMLQKLIGDQWMTIKPKTEFKWIGEWKMPRMNFFGGIR